jgi:surface protein
MVNHNNHLQYLIMFGKSSRMPFHSFRIAAAACCLLLAGLISAQSPFVTTWKTNNPGVTNNNQIRIPGVGSNYSISWEEAGNPGNSGTSIGNGTTTVTFPTASIYVVSITSGGGTFSSIMFNNEGDKNKILSVDQWGDIAWSTMLGAYYGCINLECYAVDVPNLNTVTSLQSMFRGCENLNGPPNIGDWNTANVTDMSKMFQNASIFNHYIGNWSTSNVTDMSDMFKLAFFFNHYIGDWNTANVTNMSGMFQSASSFNHYIGNWNTVNVTDMSGMFRSASSFNQYIGDWNTEKVIDMSGMFRDASSFNHYNGDWNTGNVANMSGMFQNASVFNHYIGDWNTSKVIDMSGMFRDASSFNHYIGAWNTENVIDMSDMFHNASDFNNYIGDWNTGNVSDMSGIFRDASSFNHYIGDWNTGNVSNMSGMFQNANSYNHYLGNWTVGNVANMSGMFQNANVFNHYIGDWNTSNVTDMSGMFHNASVFNHYIGNWNTANVTNMSSMFLDASSFNQHIGSWELNLGVSMLFMLNNSGMDCTNYSATLIGWVDNPSTPNGRELGAIGLEYGNDADEARTHLIDNKAWIITGDELIDEDCLPIFIAPFVTTWKTDNPGVTNNNQIRIPGTGSNYSLFWEEVGNPGNSGSALGNGTTTITLPLAGIYSVSITPGSGTYTSIMFNNVGDKEKILSVDQWGDIGWSSMIGAYFGCVNLECEAVDVPDLTTVNSLQSMFRGCETLNGPPNIGNWNTSNVLDMSDMFRDAISFNHYIGDWNTANVQDMSSMFQNASFFNHYIGTWNTENVSDMSGMFQNASAFNHYVGEWNTANVIDMSGMFRDAISFNYYIGTWNTGNVANMSGMFQNASAFNHYIGDWNTANVEDMSSMFHSASEFNQYIGDWNTANVTDMSDMFHSASSFNHFIGTWNTANVTDMSGMFQNANVFNHYIGNWELNIDVSMSFMLNNSGMDCANYSAALIGWSGNPSTPNGRELGALNLEYGNDAVEARNHLISIKAWIITGDELIDDCIPTPVRPFVTTWKSDALGVTDNNQIQIPGIGSNYIITWEEVTNSGNSGSAIGDSITIITFATPGTYSVSITPGGGTFTRIIFNNAGDKEKILSVDQWGDIAWSSMESAFDGCSNLNCDAVDVPDLSSVTSFHSMFRGCENLNGPLNIGNWSTNLVIDMTRMFSGASIFNQNIGNWNTEQVNNMSSMFENANSFNQDIGNWNMEQVNSMSNMFHNANSFNQDIGSWNTFNVKFMNAMFFLASSFNQDIGNWELNLDVNMNNMLDSCGMDCANYSATLKGWSDNPITPTNRNLHAFGREYGNDAVDARNHLIAIKSWTITGDELIDENCLEPTSIQQPEGLRALRLWPNPASDRIYLDTPQDRIITVYDLEGRPHIKMHVSAGETLISLQRLTPGMYILHDGHGERQLVVVY